MIMLMARIEFFSQTYYFGYTVTSENLGKYCVNPLLKSSKIRFDCNTDGSEGAAAELSTVVRRQIFDIAL